MKTNKRTVKIAGFALIVLMTLFNSCDMHWMFGCAECTQGNNTEVVCGEDEIENRKLRGWNCE
jgi:hypothetical protein